MYKLILDITTNTVDGTSIKRIADNAFVPFDPANTDYQAYLKWIEEGNKPEPADEALVTPAEL